VKEPLWIDLRDALAIHDRLLALEGGASGVRDAALLESALARPIHVRAYRKKADIADLAAAYMTGIIRNHPFVDGNKRVGFVVGILFLEVNGWQLTASEESATSVIFEVAAGTMDEPTLASWLRSNIKRA